MSRYRRVTAFVVVVVVAASLAHLLIFILDFNNFILLGYFG